MRSQKEDLRQASTEVILPGVEYAEDKWILSQDNIRIKICYFNRRFPSGRDSRKYLACGPGRIIVTDPSFDSWCFSLDPWNPLLSAPHLQWAWPWVNPSPGFFCLLQSHFQNTLKRISILLESDVKTIFSFSCKRKSVVCLHLNLLTKKKKGGREHSKQKEITLSPGHSFWKRKKERKNWALPALFYEEMPLKVRQCILGTPTEL